MEQKRSLSTILFGAALLIFVIATFAMFGKVVSGITSGNMFQAAFGSGGDEYIRTPGITTIFVFQMIIVAGVIAIVIGAITNKFHYILTIVLYALVCLCAFIAFIMSFNAANFYFGSGHYHSHDAGLGAGPIAFSVLHIVGLLMSAAGLVLSRKGK